MVGRAIFSRVPLSDVTKQPAAARSRVGCGEYAMTVAARVYFSSFYRLIYFFTVLSSIVCVVWVRAAFSSELLPFSRVVLEHGAHTI